MSFLATLTIEELDNAENINVLSCSYHFSQPIDPVIGHAVGQVIAGEISVTVESTKWTGLLFWLTEQEQKDGKIVFNSREQEMSRNKTLVFRKAYCTSYSESFGANNSLPMTTSISIFAEEIELGDVLHTLEWKKEKEI